MATPTQKSLRAVWKPGKQPGTPWFNRTHLKNVFWPPAFIGGIGASFKILDIQQYACGFKLRPAAILNQNPIFETGSSKPPTEFWLCEGLRFFL
jgi:hypothetical protein